MFFFLLQVESLSYRLVFFFRHLFWEFFSVGCFFYLFPYLAHPNAPDATVIPDSLAVAAALADIDAVIRREEEAQKGVSHGAH